MKNTTLSKKLKDYKIPKRKNLGTAICPECKQRFPKKTHYQIYCKRRCSNRAYRRNHPERRTEKDIARAYQYNEIKWLRREFYNLFSSNPKKALELKRQMEIEEGEEFVDFALGNILERPYFKKLIATYDKFKSVFEEKPEALV